MKVICMECKEVIKEVDGEGISHSYCQKCGDVVKKTNRVIIKRVKDIKRKQLIMSITAANV